MTTCVAERRCYQGGYPSDRLPVVHVIHGFTLEEIFDQVGLAQLGGTFARFPRAPMATPKGAVRTMQSTSCLRDSALYCRRRLRSGVCSRRNGGRTAIRRSLTAGTRPLDLTLRWCVVITPC
jgi:hypothetical protein